MNALRHCIDTLLLTRVMSVLPMSCVRCWTNAMRCLQWLQNRLCLYHCMKWIDFD
jgi:hypothetical protein